LVADPEERYTDASIEQEQFDSYLKYGKVFGIAQLKLNNMFFKIAPQLHFVQDFQEAPDDFEYSFTRSDGFIAFDRDDSIEDIGGKLLGGQMPTSDEGILISDFQYNAYRQFGYKNPSDELDILTNTQVQNMTIAQFLECSPKLSIRQFDQDLSIIGTVYPTITGVFETEYNFEHSKQKYNENSIIKVSVPTAINIVSKDYFDSQIFDMDSSVFDYKSVLVSLSGDVKTDMSRYLETYISSMLGANTQVIPYIFSRFRAELLNMYSTSQTITSMIKPIFIAMICVSLALIMYFAIVSINSSKKQIGILRSIGASSKDIFWIYMLENCFSILITFVLASIGGFAVVLSIFNRLLPLTGGFVPSFWHILILFGGLVAIMAICICTLLIILCKQKPIDAIRAGSN